MFFFLKACLIVPPIFSTQSLVSHLKILLSRIFFFLFESPTSCILIVGLLFQQLFMWSHQYARQGYAMLNTLFIYFM